MKGKLNIVLVTLFLITASMTVVATEVGGAYVTAGVVNVPTATVGYLVNKNLTVETTINGVAASGSVNIYLNDIRYGVSSSYKLNETTSINANSLKMKVDDANVGELSLSIVF